MSLETREKEFQKEVKARDKKMPKRKHGRGKLCGRTFGMQSLRKVAISFERFPCLRKAGAGGAAVALAVTKAGLYPIACFLGGFLRAFSWLSSRF
jgi:hypothetical protein